ncbi:unnamed protein product, partial [Staurois parvus]
MQFTGLAAAMGRPVICQHPMTKWNPPACVRRPESGTLAECGDGDSSNGGRTGTHDRLWTWQQH